LPVYISSFEEGKGGYHQKRASLSRSRETIRFSLKEGGKAEEVLVVKRGAEGFLRKKRKRGDGGIYIVPVILARRKSELAQSF